jgi:hypothetical protein
MPLPNLRRVRWAVRATLVLGVSASVAANVLNAQPNPISQTISAWPPLALLLAIELISRIPMDRRTLAAARLLATAGIAGIAAWVSYWHMVGVAARYGESQSSAYLLPLSVDGLVVVASVCLVELAGRIRREQQEKEQSRAAEPAPAMSAVPASALSATAVPAGAVPAGAGAVACRVEPLTAHRAQPATLRPAGPAVAPPPAAPQALPPRSPAPLGTSAGHGRQQSSKVRRPVAETATLAAAIEAAHPDISQAELARQLGISPSRLRAIKRETRELERAA